MNLFKNSLKNRKGASGAIKASLVLLTLAFALASVSYIKPVYAQHTPIITISPHYTNCDSLGNTYYVNVTNDPSSADSIFEVRIYNGTTGMVSYECGPAPLGWTLSDYAGGDPNNYNYGYCEYKTRFDNASSVIHPGNYLIFTFDAVLAPEDCMSEFLVSTLDNKRPTGEHQYTYPHVHIDCTDPIIYKAVGDPKIPGAAWDWWVTSNTPLNMFATDNETTDVCNLGIDYCRWRYALDGVPGEWTTVKDGQELSWVIYLLNDSNHNLEIECYDLARNKVILTEDDKVDNTPPVTTKTFNGPQKIKDGVEWIDGVTTVTLDPVDPDPTGHQCNIGVDKTWYKNELWGNEDPCWNPSLCQELADKKPYCDSCPEGEYPKECLDDVQKYCDGWKEITKPECVEECKIECENDPEPALCTEKCVEENCLLYTSWYDCVQKVSNQKCCGGWNWNIYDGNPIPKPQESCHVLYYFSVDNLGNLEPIKANCFFVDKTPPEISKDVGTPKVEGDNNPVNWWITQNTPITLKCKDVGPHPSDDVTIYWSYTVDDGAPVTGSHKGETYELKFKEDSTHVLEFWCKDAVEKEPKHDIETFKVDTVPPVITKTVIGPQVGKCPPAPGDICYIKDWTSTDGTTIHVEVTDPDPTTWGCNIDKIKCEYYYLLDDGTEKKGFVDDTYPPFDIKFYDDSKHELHIKCWDALKNKVEDIETFLVDSIPPETTKTYGDPFKVEPQCYDGCKDKCTKGVLDTECLDSCIHEYCVWWITSQTPITLTAQDNKVGVDKIYWRNLYFPKNDEICYKNIIGEIGIDQIPTYCHPEYYMQHLDDQNLDWNVYEGPFYKPEESCHVIEYHAVDKLGNEEPMKWQCVFVDNTAPEEIKTVGKPNLAGDGSTFDYWLTQNTPITLDCKDPEPHPVDQETMCYRVSYDLAPTGYNTEQYCKEYGGTMVYPIDSPKISTPTPTGVLADRKIVEYVPTNSIATVGTPCDSITQGAGQCAYVDVSSAPQFVKDTIIIQGGTLDNPGCDKALILSSGNPLQSGYTLNEYMGNAGCGTNPDGYDTHDCVILPSYTPSADSLALAISSEWEEWAQSTFTDWMQIGGVVDMSIRSWYTQPSLQWMYSYEPTNAGSVALATIAKSTTVQLRVADSGDFALDTAMIVVPLSCFNEPPKPEKCGDGILNPGEECDDGNNVNGDGCSEVCLIEKPTVPGWCCAKRDDGKLPYTFEFMEDSKHDLEFYCKDHLGNTAPVDVENFKVDTTSPTSTFTFNGAHFVKDGADYIDTASWITLDSKDGGDVCAVDQDKIYWQNLVYQPIGGAIDYCASQTNCDQWSPDNLDPANWNLYTGPITKDTESCHILAYYAEDALGNMEKINWKCFYVDKQPPVTTKTYGKPFFTDGKSDWITSATKVKLEAIDPMPHPSGVKETKYRVTLLAGNDACLDVTICNELKGTEDFKTYEGEFTIPEDSCHLIEYYSVDNVGKTEAVKKQCVFVDNKAPTVDKTISDPKEHWAGDNTFYPGLTDKCWSTDPAKMIECWKITMGNTLNIDCKDPHPHPVDHNKMCFQIELDGTAPEDDRTEKYCNFFHGQLMGGWCCIEGGIQNFQFLEESQHDLKVKCVDALGNAGPVDEEKFKVEGCAYELCLYKKWNLISVPFNLLNDDPEAVFKDAKDDIASVWTYDNGVWSTWIPGVGGTLENIKPGYGYWVLAKDDECFDIAGSLFSPLEVPPSRGLQSGWNLIGYYGNTMMLDGIKTFDVVDGKCLIPSKPVYCALNSLVDTQQGFPRWSSLWNYFNIGNDDAGWEGLDACVDGIWTSYMNPGKGYWIEMDVKDSYAPATNCIWNEDMQCVMPIFV